MKKFFGILVGTILLVSGIVCNAMALDNAGYYSYFFEGFDSHDQVTLPGGWDNVDGAYDFAYKSSSNAPLVVDSGDEKYGNAVKLDIFTDVTNYITTPYRKVEYSFSKGEIYKAQVSVSVNFEELNELTIHARSRSEAEDGTITRVLQNLIYFGKDGEVKLYADNNIGENVAKYLSGTWYDIDFYIDYTAFKCDIYMNETYIGQSTISNDATDFISLRLEATATESISSEPAYTKDSYVYVDNWQYNFPSYLNMENDGFTDTFADVNFNNYAENDVISSQDSKVSDSSVKGDVALINITGTPANEAGRGMVMNLTSAGWNSRLFNSRASWASVIDNNTTYKKTNPPIVKAEIDVKTSFEGNGKKLYIVARDTNGYECILASFYAPSRGERKLCFGREDQGNTVPEGNSEKADTTWETERWNKFTFYFDFANNCYDAYVEGSYMGNFKLQSNKEQLLTGLMYFGIGMSASDIEASIDNLNVSLLPLSSFDRVVRYKTHPSNENAAYCIANRTDSEVTVKMMTAKYTRNGQLEAVTIDDVKVPAWGRTFFTKNLTSDAADDLKNYTYRVFAWDGMDALKPVAANLLVDQ